MKIAVLGSRNFEVNSGGIEIHVQKLYSNILKLNQSIIIDTFVSDVENKETINSKRFRIISVKSTRIKSFEKIHYAIRCLGLLMRNQYDIVHFHGMNSIWILPYLKLFSNTKIITTQHSLDYANQGLVFYKRVIAYLT